MTSNPSHELARPAFPRASGYDPAWITSNQMGPNPLWLCEWLAERMQLKPGQRVLDLGCGKALSSIFLAREYGLQVIAADLWIDPSDNWTRITAMGEQAHVVPMRCDATALPFAQGYFDAILSIDSYFYFGRDVGMLDRLSSLLTPGGRIGAIMPGLMFDLENGPPAHLTTVQASGGTFWSADCNAYRSLSWWQEQWSRGAHTQLERAECMPEGWRFWRDWELHMAATKTGTYPSDAEALTNDGGRFIGFITLVASRGVL